MNFQLFLLTQLSSFFLNKTFFKKLYFFFTRGVSPKYYKKIKTRTQNTQRIQKQHITTKKELFS